MSPPFSLLAKIDAQISLTGTIYFLLLGLSLTLAEDYSKVGEPMMLNVQSWGPIVLWRLDAKRKKFIWCRYLSTGTRRLYKFSKIKKNCRSHFGDFVVFWSAIIVCLQAVFILIVLSLMIWWVIPSVVIVILASSVWMTLACLSVVFFSCIRSCLEEVPQHFRSVREDSSIVFSSDFLQT